MEAFSGHWLVLVTKKMFCFTSCMPVKAASQVGQTGGYMTSIMQGSEETRVRMAKDDVDRMFTSREPCYCGWRGVEAGALTAKGPIHASLGSGDSDRYRKYL